MKTLLWLDDIRNPFQDNWLYYSPIKAPHHTIWVKNYIEFIDHITTHGLPDAICFDHDLGEPDPRTGMDCAKWLVEFCMGNNLPLPEWNVHSSNPAGKDNINGLLNNFLKHQQQSDC